MRPNGVSMPLGSSSRSILRAWQLGRALFIGSSALASLVALFFYLHSFRAIDAVGAHRGIDGYRFYTITINNWRGSLCFDVMRWYHKSGRSEIPPWRWTAASSPLDACKRDQYWAARKVTEQGHWVAGFAASHWQPNEPMLKEVWFGAVPLWVVAIVMAIPLTVTFIRGRRARVRHSKGQCRNCGYDLRASPERCPECGCVPSVVQS
jgi:hypothetical protein